jgi:hypothetical protein
MHSDRIWQKESFRRKQPSLFNKLLEKLTTQGSFVLLGTTQGYILVQDTQHKLCHFRQQGITSVAVQDIPQTVGSV